MKPTATTGIILARIDFGEADRILTVLTPDYGKLHLIAKGVRRVRSKLAGGIELFSVSDITFVRGRHELGTLVSARLQTYYDHIVKDLDRTLAGYELIKLLNRYTEDNTETAYFELLHTALESLNNPDIALPLIRTWFMARIISLSGHSPNLLRDNLGRQLQPGRRYAFDVDSMAFSEAADGPYEERQVKLLRLIFGRLSPGRLQSVQHSEGLIATLAPLVETMLMTHIRL